MDSIFLQAFLLVNVFLIGVVGTIAVRHAYAHFRPAKHEPEKSMLPVVDPVHLPVPVRDRLVHEAEANFLAVLNSTVGELQHDLKQTALQLNKQLSELGSEVTVTEKGRYDAMLNELSRQTQAAIIEAQSEIAAHRAELKANLEKHEIDLKASLDETMAAERQRMIDLIDTKLADAVASFLSETLQHNVDLGAQTPYLMATLEQHKADFKREVQGEAPAPK